MFSNAVKLICEKHFDYKCSGCPLLAICDIPTQEQPGETLEEKTAWWETQMNKAAEEVPPAYLAPPDHDYLGDGEKILTAPIGRDTINTTEPGRAGGKDGTT